MTMNDIPENKLENRHLEIIDEEVAKIIEEVFWRFNNGCDYAWISGYRKDSLDKAVEILKRKGYHGSWVRNINGKITAVEFNQIKYPDDEF